MMLRRITTRSNRHLTFSTAAVLTTALSLCSLPVFADSLGKGLVMSEEENSIAYPQKLRKLGVQGNVTLSYDISAEGQAINIQQVGDANRQLVATAKASLAKENFEATPVINKQRVYRFNLTNLDDHGRLVKTNPVSTQIAAR